MNKLWSQILQYLEIQSYIHFIVKFYNWSIVGFITQSKSIEFTKKNLQCTTAKIIDSYEFVDLLTAILRPARSKVENLGSWVENSVRRYTDNIALEVREFCISMRKVCTSLQMVHLVQFNAQYTCTETQHQCFCGPGNTKQNL